MPTRTGFLASKVAIQAARKIVSLAVSTALILLSSGFEPPRALAQVVRARVHAAGPAAGLPVVPSSVAKPFVGSAPQGLGAVSFNGVLPSFGAPDLTPAPDVVSGAVAGAPVAAPAVPVAVPTLAFPVAGPGLAAPADASGQETAARSAVETLARDLVAPLADAQGIEDAGAESASAVGTRIEAVLLGRKAVFFDGASLGAPAGDAIPKAVRDGALPPTSANALPEGARDDGASAPSGIEFAVPAPVDVPSARPKAGIIGRAWDWVKGWFRVLPDPERNRQFWRFLLSQCLVSVGFYFNNTAMPNLAAPRKNQTANLGYARAAGWAAQAAANATAGAVIDRRPVQRTIVLTNLARSAVLFAVPILFFGGWLSFGAFMAVMFAAGFLESVSFSAEQIAQLRIMAGDEKHFNRANAVSALCHHVVGVLAPLLAGSFIGWMDARLGFLAGSALSYAIYGAVALAGALLFRSWLKLPREGVAKAKARLRDFLDNAKDRFPTARGAYSAAVDGATVLVVEVSGDPKAVRGMPSDFEGYPVKLVGRKTIKGTLREFADGFGIIWKDRFLRRVSLLFPALFMLAVDSVLYTALPRFIEEVLNVSAGAAFFGGIPFLGPMVAALATKAGAFGLYLAASSLGLGLSTFWMMMRQGKALEARGKGGLTPLERDGKWTSFLHGLGALAYWGIFFTTGLWWSVGAMLVAAFLKGPASVAWWSLEQKVIRERYPEDAGKVYSAMFFYYLVLSVIGVLIFGLVMETLPITAALWIVGSVMTATAVLDFIEPYAVFPISKHKKG
ncbi:MAG: hypothetical protein HY748_04505 [Elusimicrobia bacterium]|nr:hypothetical protein [Elusimicrobiota bacterium]